MIKKIFFSLTLFFISFTAVAQENDCSKDYSSLVIAENTGEILYEKRSDKFSYPASLVKMMTLYLTFEALNDNKLTLDQYLTVSERGEEIAKVNNGNTMRLKEGIKITVREAIEAVVVKSFNEAAVTLAEGVAGGEWEFVRAMNKKAQQLGMNNTSFRNASGLHEEGQYTTSYDLARLALALKRNFPQYYHFFALKTFTYRGQKYQSHNHVLLEYKGAEGMKTGFTRASGFNLVSAAKKNNESLISIVLGCSTAKSRDQLTKKLLDICFQKLEKKPQLNHFPKINAKGFDYCEKSEEDDHHVIEQTSSASAGVEKIDEIFSQGKNIKNEEVKSDLAPKKILLKKEVLVKKADHGKSLKTKKYKLKSPNKN